MRSTLFVIPHSIGDFPLFGMGICFGLLVVGFAIWLIWNLAKKRPMGDLIAGLPIWGIAAVIIAVVLPNVEMTFADGSPAGLPIRGYGVMVLLGLVLGIGVCVLRGRQVGIHPDTVIGLGFWMMLTGVVGARLFYVTQKWQEDFAGKEFGEQLVQIVKLTEGGLVIYGGVIGGLIAAVVYCQRNKLPIAATADLVAPGFLVGLSLGRIGCLLHGCCFGGVCDAPLPSIQFPQGSVPYMAQLQTVELMGIKTKDAETRGVISSIRPSSPAEELGIREGQILEDFQWGAMLDRQSEDPASPPPLQASLQVDGQYHSFGPSELPDASLPTHPSQIYSAINAALLAALVWFLQPLPRRDGVAFCSAIILYAFSRFVLEGVRSDESGQLGTGLTIAQIVGIVTICVAASALAVILRRPASRAWQWHPQAT